MENQGGSVCFSMTGRPVCMMHLVHCVISFAFSMWLCVELNILCMISVLRMIPEFYPGTGDLVSLHSAMGHFGFPTGSMVFSVAKEHPRF